MMTIDAKTGLPEVPEGYFWSVRWVWFDFAEIQLRKRYKHRWLGSRKIDDATRYTFQIDEQEIRTFTRILWNRNFGAKKPDPARKNFYGDYPPKSLNG